jgi:hypothetical protein
MGPGGDVGVEGGEWEDEGREGRVEPRQARSVMMMTVVVLGIVSLGLVAVGMSSVGRQAVTVMTEYKTTTITVGCGCCGSVSCYCTGHCGAMAGPGTVYDGFITPPLGTQAAVTPDWTDVMTSLTREVSEDTAEIAGLKATVLRQLVLKILVLVLVDSA